MQLDLCVLFFFCFFAHELLFRKLKFTRLFAVRFICCAWKFHPFQFKCVYSSYSFYADLTIYESCNTKIRITVTTMVEELTNKVFWKWKGSQTGAQTCWSHRRMMIHVIGWEVQFSKQFRRNREFISLNVRMLPLCYLYVNIYAYSTQIMLLQRSGVTLFHDYQYIFYLLKEGWQFEQ